MAEILTEDEISKMEARLAAATPGPWFWECDINTGESYLRNADNVRVEQNESNDNFVVNAPTDMRRLLDEVKRQRAELAEEEREQSVWAKAYERVEKERDAARAKLATFEAFVSDAGGDQLQHLADRPFDPEVRSLVGVFRYFRERMTKAEAIVAEIEKKEAKKKADFEASTTRAMAERAAIRAREKVPGLKVWRGWVTQETEIYVVAESEKEANLLAREHAKDEMRNVWEDPDASPVHLVGPNENLSDVGIPWSADGTEEKNAGDWLAEQLEREKETEEKARIEANQLKLFPAEVKP